MIKKILLLWLLILSSVAMAKLDPSNGIKCGYIIWGDTLPAARTMSTDSLLGRITSKGWSYVMISDTGIATRPEAFWLDIDFILTCGQDEGTPNATASTLIFLDTIKTIPVFTQQYTWADGLPLDLGTSSTYVVSGFFARLRNRDHFILKKTYLDPNNLGDSMLVSIGSSATIHSSITGSANGVKKLMIDDSSDTTNIMFAVVDSGATEADGSIAQNRRVFCNIFCIGSDYQYLSPQDVLPLFDRICQWLILATAIDTSNTKIMFSHQATEVAWMEYSGDPCQESDHYGASGSTKRIGNKDQGVPSNDRGVLIRIPTRAITTMLPDTNASWAFDIDSVKLWVVGVGFSGATTPFSMNQAWYEVIKDTLWRVAHAAWQLDKTCVGYTYFPGTDSAWVNSHYLKYKDIAWGQERADSPGVDRATAFLDTMWLNNANSYINDTMIWDIPKSVFTAWRVDSAGNNGIVSHTVRGSVTGYAEIVIAHTDDISQASTTGYSTYRKSITVIVYLDWRPAGAGATPAIEFNNDTTFNTSCYVGQSAPNVNLIVQNKNAGPLTCATVAELNDKAWLTVVTGAGSVPFGVQNIITTTGLVVGVYVDTIRVTCALASNSPFDYYVTLTVNALPIVPFVGFGGKTR